MQNANTPKTIRFRKGSTAQRELEFKLCDIDYGPEFHTKFDGMIAHWMKTGEMFPALAEEVLYEFESIADSAIGYEEDRTYRRAVDSVIQKIRTEFPDAEGFFMTLGL